MPFYNLPSNEKRNAYYAKRPLEQFPSWQSEQNQQQTYFAGNFNLRQREHHHQQQEHQQQHGPGYEAMMTRIKDMLRLCIAQSILIQSITITKTLQ